MKNFKAALDNIGAFGNLDELKKLFENASEEVKKEWKQMFRNVGFVTRSKHVIDQKNKSKWKREFGTLFVIGRKA